MHTERVLDALEQALWARSGAKGVVHHSDRGRQSLSIRYSERPAEAGAEPLVGSVGDSYDNALAETNHPGQATVLAQIQNSPIEVNLVNRGFQR